MPIKLWHLEQKLTIPLLVLDAFFCNPFYIVQAYRPSQFSILINTFLNAVFTSYFRFFVLVLFDSLKYKNRKTDGCFFGPKLFFALVQFLVSAGHGITDDVISFGESPHSDVMGLFLERFEAVLFVIYYVWTIISIIGAFAQVDVTERYKFNMYLAAVGSCLIILGLVQGVFRKLRLFRDSSLHFVIAFSMHNVFVLLMAYCHWPYEVLHDQNYVDNTGDGMGTQIVDFFTQESDHA
jgi:hypothetical protein